MYSLRSALVGQPIISLQSGQIVAWASQPVIEIATLNITALSCQSPSHNHPLLLMTSDIRQYAPDCIIIDSDDELTNPDDIVRLEIDLKNHYSPLRKSVVTTSGSKLGSVSDYTINLETNQVQQLHISKSIFQSWFGSGLIVDRSQILDIIPERITVRDSTITNIDPVLSPGPVPEI